MTKLIALAVALHGEYRTGENVGPSMTTVARYAGLSGTNGRSTATRHVKTLRDGGWLTTTGKKGPKGVKVYRLTLPGVSTERVSPGTHNIELLTKKKGPLRRGPDTDDSSMTDEKEGPKPSNHMISSQGITVASRREAINEEIKAAYSGLSDQSDWNAGPWGPDSEGEAPF